MQIINRIVMAKFYKVGGWVRDKFLDRPSTDIDYSVEAKSYQDMLEGITSRGLRIIYEKKEFFTIRAGHKGAISDYVLCRKDGHYRDGRRPSEVTEGTLLDDLARRDFTMNAIAEDDDGNWIDPFGGIKDIENKIIRCVGSTERLKEDALRLLRAVRFLIVLPGFTLHKDIEDALNNKEVVSLLQNISDDRIREELEKCFKHDSLLTIKTLHKFPLIMEELFQNKQMWLKPTFEKIKKKRTNMTSS